MFYELINSLKTYVSKERSLEKNRKMDYLLWYWNKLKQLKKLNSSWIRRSNLHEIKGKQFFPGVFQWFKLEIKIKKMYRIFKNAFNACF